MRAHNALRALGALVVALDLATACTVFNGMTFPGEAENATDAAVDASASGEASVTDGGTANSLDGIFPDHDATLTDGSNADASNQFDGPRVDAPSGASCTHSSECSTRCCCFTAGIRGGSCQYACTQDGGFCGS